MRSEGGGEYKSIEEVRSTFYPGSAAMLDLEKEEVLEFPTSLAKSLENIARPGVEAEAEDEEDG